MRSLREIDFHQHLSDLLWVAIDNWVATMCHHAIEKVFQLAAATFSKKAGPDSFTGNLEKLISLTNKLGGSDVGLDRCAALQKSINNSPNNTQDSPRGSRDRCTSPLSSPVCKY